MLQRELVAKAGKKPPITYSLFTDYEDDVYARVADVGTDLITKANSITEKSDRNAALDGATQSIMADLESEFPERGREVKAAVRSLTKKIVRSRIVEEGIRIDGRGTSDLRPLSAEVDLIPTAHGTGTLPTGRDPGPEHHHPGYAPNEPDARHHRHRRVQAVHAPLQLPPLLHR